MLSFHFFLFFKIFFVWPEVSLYLYVLSEKNKDIHENINIEIQNSSDNAFWRQNPLNAHNHL